jgi:hypothetical protein
MKITSTRGDWTGLSYWKDCSYRVDHFSTPDGWEFGFDVVYRLVFNTSEINLIERCRTSLKDVFGLSDSHYDLNQQPQAGNSVFWRVYWDRKGFELDLLKQCEIKLNVIAEAANIRITILEMAIIPRSLDHIRKLVELNK